MFCGITVVSGTDATTGMQQQDSILPNSSLGQENTHLHAGLSGALREWHCHFGTFLTPLIQGDS